MEKSFEKLQNFPLSGALREMFAPGMRVTFQDKYAIYYLPANDELVIVRVLHGARDSAAIAEEGGFVHD